jgi:hypothetical protein
MSELALKDFDILSDAEKAEALALLKKYGQLEKQDECQGDFINFVKHMWPEFVEGRHHKIIGEKFNRIAQGKLKRLIVCLPPRHTKSEFASTYFPAGRPTTSLLADGRRTRVENHFTQVLVARSQAVALIY